MIAQQSKATACASLGKEQASCAMPASVPGWAELGTQ